MSAPETAATTPEPSRGVPIVSDFARLVKAMYSPGEAYAAIRERPAFWGTWLVVSILFAVTGFLQAPFQAKVQALAMAEAGRDMPQGSMFAILGMVMTPIIVLVIASIGALVLWVTVSLTGGEARFKQALSINIHSWGPVIIQQAVIFAVLKMRGLDQVSSRLDLMVPLGLDLVLPAETMGFLRGLLNGINPFSIWSTVIIAVGLQTMLKMEAGKAWTVAIITFLVGIAVAASLTGLFT